MALFLGFGTGRDGVGTLTGTIAPREIATTTGTAGNTTGTTETGKTFAVGDFVYIHQSQGTGAGAREVNRVKSYTSGTGAIEFDVPLANTYAAGAQMLDMYEFSSVTVTGAASPAAWDGTKFGIYAYMCSGRTTVNADFNATGKGFRGGAAQIGVVGGSALGGFQGEGTTGVGIRSTAANTNGGGASAAAEPSSGAGAGGNSTAGENGVLSGGVAGTPGTGGTSAGSADLTTIVFGGGGASAGGQHNDNDGPHLSGAGAIGGGIIEGFTRELFIDPTTGWVSSNGNPGGNAQGCSLEGAGGGAGAAGGSIKFTSETITNANRIRANGGTYGLGSGSLAARGGIGAEGRIALVACSITGESSPAANKSLGGHTFCGSILQII